MTVCIAASSENRTMIVGASDRMLTAGDIEFEPGQAKIWMFTNSICAMISGDATLQFEILKDVDAEVKQRVGADPNNWWRVRDVADIYIRHYRRLLLRHAERDILSPLGLDINSFFEKQHQMTPDLVEDISKRLTEYHIADLSAIFVGVDTDCPQPATGEPNTTTQIYVVHDGRPSCSNGVGFAAIGAGAFHAESQFMFSGHWPQKPFPDTVLLTYMAKKRAEVAPGVGGATDMFALGPKLGSFVQVAPDRVTRLDEIYGTINKRTEEAISEAQKETRDYLDQLANAVAQRQDQKAE